MAVAQGRGLSADQLVPEAIHKILSDVPEASTSKEPARSLRGLLAKYGPAPSAAEIHENRNRDVCEFPAF